MSVTVTTTVDFESFEPWSGAVSTWEELKELGLISAFEDYIEDICGSEVSDTTINDILWFESDRIFDYLKPKSEDYAEVSEESVAMYMRNQLSSDQKLTVSCENITRKVNDWLETEDIREWYYEDGARQEPDDTALLDMYFESNDIDEFIGDEDEDEDEE